MRGSLIGGGGFSDVSEASIRNDHYERSDRIRAKRVYGSEASIWEQK